MKKKLVMLFVLVASLSMLSACGSDVDEVNNEASSSEEMVDSNVTEEKQETKTEEMVDSNATEEKQETETEVIEITSDNWQNYLEFGMVPCAVYEGSELVNIEIHNCIYIKNEYVDAFIDGNINGVVTASAGMPMTYNVRYYLNSKDFNIDMKVKDSSSGSEIKSAINENFSVSGDELIKNNEIPTCIWCMEGYTMLDFTSNDDDGKGDYNWAMCLNPEDIAVENVSGTIELIK